MKLIEPVASLYRPLFAKVVVYMLQASEYNVRAYLAWLWRTQNFSRVMYRKKLVMTRPAELLLGLMYLAMSAQIVLALLLEWQGWHGNKPWVPIFALAVFLATPIIWAHLIVLPLLLGRWLIIGPLTAVRVKQSRQVFKGHAAVKIAIAGSYGKTTMKEILVTILKADKKVAAASGNKNVPSSHARFAKSLKGDEDILIIEYGEGTPGDVVKFTRNTHPDIGIITGLAPAHLDKYKTLNSAGKDIFSLAYHLSGKNVYVNGESLEAKTFIKPSYQLYSSSGALGWKVEAINSDLEGLSFNLKKGNQTMKLKTKLLGKHQVGPVALSAALAHKLGVSIEKIEIAASSLVPYDHRMQLYQLSGAWIIDDTYNGNIEGMRAGLELLKSLPAKRKVYVTPGLVDQGEKSPQIHHLLGELIAKASPDKTVLIKHSVTDDIIKGLESNDYKGELVIEKDALRFYTNLDQSVAAGDLVLMQNDWPDNYN